LNDRQKLAVDTVDGPVLVLAGPGTGKTQLLSIRAAAILKKRKAAPENILVVTYTNSAAKAMKERLASVIGEEGYNIEVGTFHAFANSIIQDSEEAANYTGDKIQMSEIEQVRAVEYALDHAKGVDEIRPFRAPYMYTGEVLQKIGELKRDGITPGGFAAYMKRKSAGGTAAMDEKYVKRLHAFGRVYAMYEDLKSGTNKDVFDERGRYDFDDMILFATEALKKEEGLRERYRSLYRYVMVDEYQDTNGAQMDLLFTLLDYKDPNLCCVGDDDQSIYRFQGASIANFKLLHDRFRGIREIHLKDNYRSAQELIKISDSIIRLIPAEERVTEKSLAAVRSYAGKEIEFREFTTESEELVYIIDKIRELREKIERDRSIPEEERSHPYNNIAILVRKRKNILTVIDALLGAGIPYATDGKEDISGEKRVRQLLDILELASADPSNIETKDLDLYRVLIADYFEIPHADLLRFIGHVNAGKAKDRTVSILSAFLEYPFGAKDEIRFTDPKKMIFAREAVKRLLGDARSRPVHEILLSFIKDAGIFRFILEKYADNGVMKIRELRALSSFINMVKRSDLANPGVRLDDFMSELKTRKDHGMPIQGSLVTMTQDGVRVFTAHGSKGQEFRSVIIPFCIHDKNWPIRQPVEKIPLPAGLFRAREKAKDKDLLKKLFLYDETRLFYVAITRARSNLIFTSSPAEGSVSSPYVTHLDIASAYPDILPEEEVMARSLSVTDLEDPFIGTEAVLKDMISNMTLNPTRLNNYIRCRRKFLYTDVLKLPGTKKKSLVFGNCVHKGLEETYAQYMKTGRFPPFNFFFTVFRRELKFQGVDKAIELHCLGEGQIDKLKGWFAIASRNPVMPIGLERKLAVTVGDGIIFTGKYDRMEWEDEAGRLVRIVDYKTGKPDDHLKSLENGEDLASDACEGYLRQLVAYRMLFEKDKKESGPMRARAGVLVFIEPINADMRRLGYKKGDYVSKRIEITDEMVARLEEVIKEVWANIKDLQFEKLKERDEKKCGNCDFDTVCWR